MCEGIATVITKIKYPTESEYETKGRNSKEEYDWYRTATPKHSYINSKIWISLEKRHYEQKTEFYNYFNVTKDEGVKSIKTEWIVEFWDDNGIFLFKYTMTPFFKRVETSVKNMTT